MSLLKTLEIMECIVDAPRKMQSLELYTGLSSRQIMRHIEEAQKLGADITSTGGRAAEWQCHNRSEIEKSGILKKWLEIERNHSVLK